MAEDKPISGPGSQVAKETMTNTKVFIIRVERCEACFDSLKPIEGCVSPPAGWDLQGTPAQSN